MAYVSLVASEATPTAQSPGSRPFSCLSPDPGWSHRCPLARWLGLEFILVPFLPEWPPQPWTSSREARPPPAGPCPGHLQPQGFSFDRPPSSLTTPTSCGSTGAHSTSREPPLNILASSPPQSRTFSSPLNTDAMPQGNLINTSY